MAAKTKREQQQKRQQLLLVIYLKICLAVISLSTMVDSVSCLNIPLDGNGNILLQQPQHQQHVIDNTEQWHNFIMDPKKQHNTENGNEEEMKKSNADFRHQFNPITMADRAPGNKLFEETDMNSEAAANENDLNFNLPWHQLQNPDEVINWNVYANPDVRRYKKAPTAFYGVRGKKFVNMNGINVNSDNSQWHDFLQKLEEERLRDALIQDFVERLAGAKSDPTNDMTKRAPTGFTGVRGKRLFLNQLDSSMENLSKRGLGNNAFIGVRGKKDVSHQTAKRSLAGPERYFFAFWKKSLPGRNGKRQRFVDFNNKFVAVRGKKSSYNDMSALNAISDNAAALDPLSLSSFDKRTPKGFLGMRGKRHPVTADGI